MQHLYIIRGVPGSGKSTLAKTLWLSIEGSHWWEADMYFSQYCGDVFDAKKLPAAHAWCREMTEDTLAQDKTAIVSNTFTQAWEFEPYIALAKQFYVPYTSLIVENRHNNKSVHNVPDDTVDKMKSRFNIKL
jgi:predicted kinase